MGDSGPSASPTSAIGNNYYVFLSFRGADTRKGFTDYLHGRLKAVGLPFHPNFVFRDNDDLHMGDPVGDGLFSAIDHSKVSIPIISERYADSKWCLLELIRIMKCHESRGQIVLPVLYKVKTDDVKSMKGPFGEAFHSKTRYSDEFKKEAKEALQKALELRVYKSDEDYSGHEGKLVEELVETIRCHMQRNFPTYPPVDLVGFDAHVAKVMNLADIESPETRIIVIHGIGGVGKTALVTSIYNKLFDKFQWHSFLKDIRETIKSKDMLYVQSLLVSDLTKDSERTVRHSDIGSGQIQQASEGKKVLVVLDDVDCQDHLDKLIGVCNCGSGSRIFITCQDKTLLKSEYKEHELQKMNPTDCLFLFNRHAFGMKQPSEEFAYLSSKIVDATGGLPLALVIVGSLLKDKDISIWKETLEKLKKAPNEDVQKVLRISYDSLGYEEQQMFLDIACFFIGIDKRIATYLWDDLKFFPTIGLKALINRSLIIDDNNELRMHDHLRHLGRAIARPADKKPWKCSRLWDEEAITVQRSKEENRYIEALRLNKNGSTKFMEGKSFKRMPYLKFLRLSEAGFAKCIGDSFAELRWLEWEKCPESFEETQVNLEKLLILNLSRGDIRDGWKGWELITMEKLKVLNLSLCSHLEKTPDLSRFENLEMLILENCEKLVKIDPSIGHVKCLISLNVMGCQELKMLPIPQLGELKNLEELLVDGTSIEEFPDCIGSLAKLKTLSARSCFKLNCIPDSIGRLERLTELNLSKANISTLPESIGHVKRLISLNVRGCRELKRLPAPELGELENLEELLVDGTGIKEFPDCIGSLAKLKTLSASGCYGLTRIPDSIGCLERLTELDLSMANISTLPESIGGLKNLQWLKIAHCENLTTLPNTLCKLDKLEGLDAANSGLRGEVPINGMSSLRILRLRETHISGFPDTFDELSRLEKLDLDVCDMLRSLPQSISKLHSLQHLNLFYCRELQLLPALPPSLKGLTVTNCRSLESMPILPSTLLNLWVDCCDKLEELPSLSSLGSLSELHLGFCKELTKIEGLKALRSLEELSVGRCPKLSNLDGLEDLESLRRLRIHLDHSNAPPWKDDLSLVRLKNLEELRIVGWRSLRRLDLSQSTHLKHLSIKGCSSLEELHVSHCSKLSNLDGLEGLESLRRLTISLGESNAPLWNDDLSLVRLKNLEELRIEGCRSLRRLDLSQSTHLKHLSIKGCSSLVEIKGLSSLIKNLESWNRVGCPSLDISNLESWNNHGLTSLDILEC